MSDLPNQPPILSIDFDGVLHSYASGWKGPRNIPDPPVIDPLTGQSAIEWLSSLLSDGDAVCAMAPRFLDFDVRIFSSRARYWGGRRAIKLWLVKYGFPADKLERLRFPLWKPPSFLHIDDRALCFEGRFPTAKELLEFRPWYRRGGALALAKCEPVSYLQPKDGQVLPGIDAEEVVWAERQPQYNPLRGVVLRSSPGRPIERTMSRWAPTAEQREAIAKGSDIFLEQWIFGARLQPVRLMIANDDATDELAKNFIGAAQQAPR